MSRDDRDRPGHRAGPLLRIERQATVSGAVLVVRGEIDLYTGDQFAEQLERVVVRAIASTTPVVVDLRAVTFFGAVGLGVLASANERCLRAGVPMAVVADQPTVLRVLRIAGLDRVLTVRRAPPTGAGPTRDTPSELPDGDR